MNFARFRTNLRLHAPETAGTVQVISIGDENNFGAFGRPHGTDLVIVGTVVIPWQRALVFTSETLDVGKYAIGECSDEDVKPSVKRCGDKSDALTVGRKTWLNVDRSILRE